MLKPTEEQIKNAQQVVGTMIPFPVAYRIAIKDLDSTSGLKAGEAEKFATLAKAGFTAQSKKQTDRETKGAAMGILCYIGGGCFQGNYTCGNDKPKVGDVVVYQRYAGMNHEYPPGSGDFYRFCNDEDITGKYEVGV